jgi:lysophospholipase L1-like esterase
MRLFLAFCALAGTAFAADEAKPVKVVLAGDSTVNDEGGWGPGFRESFGPGIQVINLARNGRSSKSFRDEGLWSGVIAAKPDYVLIQFGHNDVPGKGPERETDPKTTYHANMVHFIDESRAAHATPILVTSIVRRNFTVDGKIKTDSLSPYVTEVRAIAVEKSVPLIELYNLSREQAEKAGPTGAVEIGRIGPDSKLDTTHLGPKGQQEIGRMAAREFARLIPAVRPFLISERIHRAVPDLP